MYHQNKRQEMEEKLIKELFDKNVTQIRKMIKNYNDYLKNKSEYQNRIINFHKLKKDELIRIILTNENYFKYFVNLLNLLLITTSEESLLKIKIKSAFDDFFVNFDILNSKNHLNILKYFEEIEPTFHTIVKNELEKNSKKILKIKLISKFEYEKINDLKGSSKKIFINFQTGFFENFDISKIYENMKNEIISKFGKNSKINSNLIFRNIKKTKIIRDLVEKESNSSLKKSFEKSFEYKSNGSELYHPFWFIFGYFENIFCFCNHQHQIDLYTNNDRKKLQIEFNDRLQKYALEYNNFFQIHKPANKRNDDDKLKYKFTNTCHICMKKIHESKVWDHDHLTGKYRGAAHSLCNLKLRLPKFVPIFVENLKKFMKWLPSDKGKIKAIPCDNYFYVSKMVSIQNFESKKSNIEFRFIDFYSFFQNFPQLLKSLLNIDSCYCVKCKKEFKINSQNFSKFEIKNRNIYNVDECIFCERKIEQKINMENFKRFNDNFGEINEKCKLLQNFFENNFSNDLKLRTILLYDIFDNFRQIFYKNYTLDPVYYTSLSNLTFSTFLKHTKLQIDFNSENIEIYEFIQKANNHNNIIFHDLLYVPQNNDTINKNQNKESRDIPEVPISTKFPDLLQYNKRYTIQIHPKPLNFVLYDAKWLTEEELSNFKFEHETEGCTIILQVDLKISKNKIEKDVIIHSPLLAEYLNQNFEIKIIEIKRGIKLTNKAKFKNYQKLKNEKLYKNAKTHFEKYVYELISKSFLNHRFQSLSSKSKIIKTYSEIENYAHKYESRIILKDNVVLLMDDNQPNYNLINQLSQLIPFVITTYPSIQINIDSTLSFITLTTNDINIYKDIIKLNLNYFDTSFKIPKVKKNNSLYFGNNQNNLTIQQFKGLLFKMFVIENNTILN